MNCQTKAFFMFIFIVLTLRTLSTVANPIFFDIIENENGNKLFEGQVEWISIVTITQAVSELAFNGMMIVYLV